MPSLRQPYTGGGLAQLSPTPASGLPSVAATDGGLSRRGVMSAEMGNMSQ
jgi:hypothetical protein